MSKAIIRGREMRLPASPLAEEQRLIYKEEGLRALALGHQRRRNGGGGGMAHEWKGYLEAEARAA
jgi:hypothetical protein